MRIETEVLIVGYGPVGATIACLLGQHGVKALVVDKATDVYLAPRAIALDNEALRILQMAGLTERSFDRVAIPYVKLHSPYVGQFARINTCGSIDGHPKLVTFYQPELERALRSRVAQLASVRALLGLELKRFVDRDDHVEAHLEFQDGAPVTVRAQYLVGADGACSAVRHAIGLDFAGRTYPQDWLIVDARRASAPMDHVEFICDPRRPTPHMVAPGGRQRWEFMLHRDEDPAEMERDDTIAQLLSRWGDPEQMQIERKAVYRFHARCCDAFSKGRVFLAGDAAHVTPPFAGQGLVAGLRDAANLCWKLAAVTQGQASPRILETYDQERRPHATAMIGLAQLMGRLVMPANPVVAFLLHGLLRVLRLFAPMRRLFDDLGMKPQNRFDTGLFHASAGPLTPGGLLPQGLVRDAAGAMRPSDEMLGPGLTLIGFGLPPSLTPETADEWAACGGSVAQLCHAGQRLHRDPALDFEDVEGKLIPAAAPFGWVAVVRPDRVVVHQGPAAEADRIVRESLALLGIAERRSPALLAAA